MRVRFAPSPTGPFHIGSARTALYNYLAARSLGGTFILRIDDTDLARSSKESLENILESMTWLGLHWDEGPGKEGEFGPYFQSERSAGYKERARRLVELGHAYPCFCTAEEISEGRERMQEEIGVPMYDRRCRDISAQEASKRQAEGEGHTLRFKIPFGRKVQVKDTIKGNVEINLEQIDDWVMLRNDGSPLYNLCSTLDDIDMKITHVIRGEEHFVNAVKQILLFEALGEEAPAFVHLPLILGKNGKKLSKRMAQTNILDYKEQGYPPEALVNFFTLLGWSFDGETEIFSVEDAVSRFRLENLGRSGSIFDEEKMAWMCGMYIRNKTVADLLAAVTPFVLEDGRVTAEQIDAARPWFENLVACFQERIKTYSELPPKLRAFVEESVEYDPKARKNLVKKPDTKALLATYLQRLEGQNLPPSWPLRPAEADTALSLPSKTGPNKTGPSDASGPFATPMEIEADARSFAEEQGIGFGQLVHPIRAALTGTNAGPGLFDIVYLLGAKTCKLRIEAAISFLAHE